MPQRLYLNAKPMSLLLKKSKLKGPIDSVTIKDAYWKMAILCLALAASSIFFNLILAIGIFKVASKPAPTLVQLSNGDSIYVEAIDTKERSPESIQKFVTDILTAMFTWSGTMPDPDDPAKIVSDPGVPISDEKGNKIGKIPTSAFEASLAFELNFRSSFLRQLGRFIPESIFTNKTDVAFVPIDIQPPVSIGKERWKVTVLSNLMFVDRHNQIGSVVPYHVDVYLKSVTKSQKQLIAEITQAQSRPLAQQIARIRQAGLEIYAITYYHRKDLKDAKPNFRATEPEPAITK
jgi:hypothetical protein